MIDEATLKQNALSSLETKNNQLLGLQSDAVKFTLQARTRCAHSARAGGEYEELRLRKVWVGGVHARRASPCAGL